MTAENPKTIVLPQIDEVHPEVTLSVDREPLVKPTKDSKRILVIGGGVSGLMTAWILLDKGYRVTIVSKEWAWTRNMQHSRLTSQIAGALWEFPPGGCGLTEVDAPGKGWAGLGHYREWALESYEFYKKLNDMLGGQIKRDFGVTVAKLNQFFYHDLKEADDLNSEDFSKLEAAKKAFADHRIDNLKEHDPESLAAIFDQLNVDQQWRQQLKAGYTHDAPIINTDRAMAFLMSLIKNKGADLETRELKEALPTSANILAKQYNAAAIINATGLGAALLAPDPDVYPVRGAIKRLENTSTSTSTSSSPHLKEAYLIPAQRFPSSNQPTKVIFIVPRSDSILIVGSIIQPQTSTLNLASDSPEVENMWTRALSFLPALNDRKPIPEYPLAQGLRPFTRKNAKVRAEWVDGGKTKTTTLVVHNYGHGGSGWTLGVGCARSAVGLLEGVGEGGRTVEEVNGRLYPG
ncbi:MAG: hypothetical protein Q9160_008882 [Pyrenula sp. 1 TL-2023]